jgi:hypothetical protein
MGNTSGKIIKASSSSASAFQNRANTAFSETVLKRIAYSRRSKLGQGFVLRKNAKRAKWAWSFQENI